MCDSVETKKCMNCKIDILLNNFEVHSLHCLKNFYFCTKCQQPVNNIKKKEHEENHFIIQCASCDSNFEQHHLNDHLQYYCPHRKVRCQICDIDVKATEIDEHEDYCGSRTERCLKCNEFVMLKYKAIHVNSNHTFFKLADEPGPSPSWQNSKRMLFDYIPDLTMKQSKQKISQKKKCLLNQEAKFKVSLSKNDKVFNSIQNENLLGVSEKNKKMTLSKLSPIELPEKNSFSSEKDQFVRDGADIYSILPSFKQLQLNGEPVTYSQPTFKTTEQNENENCFNNSMSTSKSDNFQTKKMPKFYNYLKENNKATEKYVEKNVNSTRSTKFKSTAKINFHKNCYKDIYVESKEFNKLQFVEVHCEFCTKLVPIQDLAQHQATCDLIYFKNINKKKKYLNRKIEDDEEVKLPCEICEKLMNASQLETHQYYCKIKNTKSYLESGGVLDKRNEKCETFHNQLENFKNTTENQLKLNESAAQFKSPNKSDEGAIPKAVKVTKKTEELYPHKNLKN